MVRDHRRGELRVTRRLPVGRIGRPTGYLRCHVVAGLRVVSKWASGWSLSHSRPITWENGIVIVYRWVHVAGSTWLGGLLVADLWRWPVQRMLRRRLVPVVTVLDGWIISYIQKSNILAGLVIAVISLAGLLAMVATGSLKTAVCLCGIVGSVGVPWVTRGWVLIVRVISVNLTLLVHHQLFVVNNQIVVDQCGKLVVLPGLFHDRHEFLSFAISFLRVLLIDTFFGAPQVFRVVLHNFP